MQKSLIGINDPSKGGKEGQKGNDESIEDILEIHAICHFGVKTSKGLCNERKKEEAKIRKKCQQKEDPVQSRLLTIAAGRFR